MDTNDKDKSDLEKKNDEPLSYQSLGVSSDWRYDIPNFDNSSVGLVSSGDGVGPSCSSTSMADSTGPTIWENPINTAPLGFNELNVHNDSRVSNPLSILKGGLFLPNMMSAMLPHNLSQFPTDSAFIERAARFSSFSGGHFGDLLNSMGMSQSCGPFGQDGVIMQGPQAMMGRQSQKPEASLADVSKDVCLVPGNGAIDGNSPKNETMVERSRDEAKQGVMSGNESDEPECSGGFAKDIGEKKRKRGNQAEQANANDLQSGEAKKNSDIQQKGDQNSTPTSNKSNGKQVKQNSQASDSPKEEYIHVRAQRGQATNSHSLAERVRREKISERMKFLQDLVPGCSKVTGKAVMLDEIINYVQSLQRQVEFLSMKLATVNPQLDFNIDRFLTEDVFSARAGPSSGPTFSPDIPMPYHPLHPGQSPMLPPVLSGTGNPNDALRRVIASQLPNMGGGYKEPSSQLPNAWDGELHNIVHMGFNANAPLDKQDGNGLIPQEQMNADS